jgi:DNA-binding GntR family transcriptional regulator
VAAINRAETLGQRAYTALREAIRDGALVQDRVYSEGELAESMGISRTPVREALIELSREGLVEVLPQRGFSLRSLDREERAEVFGLRLALEEYVVDLLASQASATNVRQLRDLLERQHKVASDPIAFLALDERFHLLMPHLLGLKRTHRMLLTLRGAMWLIGSVALNLHERIPHVLEEHEAILTAVEAGDSRGARRAVRRHLQKTHQAVEASAPADGLST